LEAMLATCRRMRRRMRRREQKQNESGEDELQVLRLLVVRRLALLAAL
jgi:hypothetical protein